MKTLYYIVGLLVTWLLYMILWWITHDKMISSRLSKKTAESKYKATSKHLCLSKQASYDRSRAKAPEGLESFERP